MKAFIIIIFLAIKVSCSYSQLPEFSHNYTKLDSINNILIDSFALKYDLVIAYSENSYWYKDKPNYKILTKKADKWGVWTYSNKIINPREFLNGANPEVLNGIELKPLLDSFSNSSFWNLNNDSLKNDVIGREIIGGDTILHHLAITDGITYRFDTLTKDKARFIQANEPETYIKRSPTMYERIKFVQSRDEFLKWWNIHCH